MSSTGTQLRDMVIARNSIKGSLLNDDIDTAVILACEEICVVDFDILYVHNATIQILTGQVNYLLPALFKKIDEDNVYISTTSGSERMPVVAGNMQEIYFKPQATQGIPRKYCVKGMETSSSQRTIFFGCLTANTGHTVTYGYWRKHGTFIVGDVPIISRLWKDIPIVCYASYLINKQLGKRADAQDDFQEFCGYMREGENDLGYSGPSYDEILEMRAQVEKFRE